MATSSTHKSSVDHSANVILFSVPELSLTDTKSVIDKVTLPLIGKSISTRDTYHIGRKKPSSVDSSCPRLFLIKLDNCWDRRILLNSHRDDSNVFVKFKLFIREDLLPNARVT